MFVILYETKEQLCGNNLIEHIDVVGKQYIKNNIHRLSVI